MKCPNCEKWNRAGMPHCIYCGADLPQNAYNENGYLPWQQEMKNQEKPKAYIRVDEFGQYEEADDPRDQLADEMVSLKARKIAGEEEQRRLRQAAARRGMAPSGRTVHTTSNRSTFFSAYTDDPTQTLRTVDPQAEEKPERPAYGPRYHTSYDSQEQEDMYGYGNSRRLVSAYQSNDPEALYDGYRDTSAYIPDNGPGGQSKSYTMRMGAYDNRRKTFSMRRFVQFLAILTVAVLLVLLVWKYVIPMVFNQSGPEKATATVTPTIRNELANHTITIPGEDGQRIMIKELRTSAIVVGGVATFDIPDHIWYDDHEDYVQETMTVTVSPYLVSDSGKQTALEQIQYEIDIPLSPIDLITPDTEYLEVSTALFNIVFTVREGSKLTINGEDYSDLVNTNGGRVSYNATVQPIGENTITIVVRSQYCRENTKTITLYREPQEIPLDLASDIASSGNWSSASMLVRATTLPGATVKVLSPHSDLDITTTAQDGAFNFIAKMDKIGNNTIIITADYPGKKTTRVEHNVYYVPNIDIYSRKAWDIVTQYRDLMDNLELRKSQSQIYVCKGVITSIETTKPQRAFMNVGTEESPLMVFVENSSKTQWEEGKSYRLYGDAFGMYQSAPWLVVRYTYGLNDPG